MNNDPGEKNRKIRLNRYMAMAGVDSRRDCDELIKAGRVSVNGAVTDILSTEIDPEKDVVELDGRALLINVKWVYILLHKPLKYVTTVHDDKGRDSVVDLIKSDVRVYPVGRLDYDTTGLLLLTNDGELTYRLMHPKFGVEKTYIAELSKKISEQELNLLRRGVMLVDGKTAPAKAVKLGKQLVEITIHEGKNKQVKRMFRKLGFKVRSLHRSKYGPILLGKLKYGQYRMLKPFEVTALKKLVGM
jgi:23S rRNA pseudouridine2605 synthase